MGTLNRALAMSTIAFLLLSSTPLAQASGVPTVDIVANAFNAQNLVQTTIGTVSTVADTAQNVYEWMQTFTLAALKKKLVDGLSDKIVGYAQGGGKGAKFVVNWQDYLGKASVTGVKAANDSVASSNVCSSFRKPLLKALGAPSTNAGNGNANPNLNCDFAPGELEAIEKNPANGSLQTYKKTLEPQNNIYGAYWIAKSEQSRQAAAAKEAAQSEAVAGGGFISPKSADGTISTPGSVIKDLTSKAAGSDIDLIVNATQLKDLVGSIGSSLINEVTKSNDSGLSGVNLAARRKARNNTRNATTGKVIATEDATPDCDEVALSFVNDINDFDADKNGTISSAERQAAIDSEQGIYDSCVEGRTAQTGNQNAFSQTTVAEILAKRREAQKFLDDMVAKLNRTQKNLENYLTLGKSKLVKFDNPNYNPDTDNKKEAYAFAKDVWKRRCFTVEISGTITVNAVSRARAVITYIDDPAKPDFDSQVPITSNIVADGKEIRCTMSDGSEIDYYKNDLIPKITKIFAGNRLALKKLDALKAVIVQRSKTGPAALRNEKVAEALADFNCIGNPYMCIKTDPADPTQHISIGFTGDQSPSKDEPGYVDAGSWTSLPIFTTLPSYILNRLSLTTNDNTTAREGMITFYNGDYNDDPSNPLYDPAFDENESDLVYEAAKGNFAILGGIQEPEADTGQGVAADDGGEQ